MCTDDKKQQGLRSRHSDFIRAGRSGGSNRGGGKIFRTVQTGPEAQTASCTEGTESIPVLKRPRRGLSHPLPLNVEVKERVESRLYSISGPSWPVLG
jgi:hypothetical protein